MRRIVFGQKLMLAALLIVLLPGCSRGSYAQAIFAPSPSHGCGKTAAQTGVFTVTDRDVTNLPRSYVLQIPSGYQPDRAYPLIFVFHGMNGTSQQAMSWGLQNAKGAAGNAIFVFPQAARYLTYGIAWDDRNNGVDFLQFDAMLKEVESSYCVNQTRVFVAGFSAGGDYVTALVCQRGDVIRGAAANSTTDEYNDIHNYMTFQNMPCKTHQYPAIRYEHALGGDSAYPPPDFATTSQLFRHFGSCSGSALQSPSSGNVSSCVAYAGCRSRVVECTFDPKIGHALPPSWAQDTWDFFASLP